MKNILLVIVFFFVAASAFAQKLKPGFDANEYARLLEMTERFADTTKVPPADPYPYGWTHVFRSETVGLDNLWDMWLSGDSVAVMNIRGTIASEKSWMLDFYAPMVPAEGSLKFGKEIFTYKLASDKNAAVHTGFLLGMHYLAPSVIEKINEYYNKGVKDFIVCGHSQGAAIAYLMRSYLHYLPYGTIPADITIKTYNSAAPKPGNLYYAYDFEYITRGGWSHRVVNQMDWVPQMPPTVQTRYDFKHNDPFTPVDSTLAATLGFFPRIVIGLIEKSVLGDMNDARDVLIKYTGAELYKVIKTFLPSFQEPKYVSTMDYTVTASPVILMPTEEYRQKFVSTGGIAGAFVHHMMPAYYFLLKQEYMK